MIVVTAKQMLEIEKSAADHDMTMARLMENAGSAAAATIRRHYPVTGVRCMVFSGRGNNGGDGLVVARKLFEYGADVHLVLVQGEPRSPQSQQMYAFLKMQQVPVLSLENQRERVAELTEKAELIVDAVFGVGFKGTLTGQSLIACDMINAAAAPVVSLDAPSGISSDRGEISYGAIHADRTVVFQLHKPLHLLARSREYCGEIDIVDIGIPPSLYANVKSQYAPINEELVWKSLPPRPKDSHKGTFGHALALVGSAPYRGAATLAATGILRGGAGLCTVAAPEVVCAAVAAHRPEAIFCPLPVNRWGEIHSQMARPLVEKRLRQADAILLGCGWGQSPATLELLQLVLQKSSVPVVLDADALNLLADHPTLLDLAACPLVLTPHPGEMARLIRQTVADVESDREGVALSYATQQQVTLVLKGSQTLVALPDGQIRVNQTGNAGLATGGSGDLLAGLIASLLAQGLTCEQAAACGVWLHGAAADRTAKRLSQAGMLPMDVAEDVGVLLQEKDE